MLSLQEAFVKAEARNQGKGYCDVRGYWRRSEISLGVYVSPVTDTALVFFTARLTRIVQIFRRLLLGYNVHVVKISCSVLLACGQTLWIRLYVYRHDTWYALLVQQFSHAVFIPFIIPSATERQTHTDCGRVHAFETHAML